MSSLTSIGFTATQYALFSSLYALPGKIIASQSGKIVAVGPGKLSEEGVRIEPDVEVGQTVLYGKYSGTEVTVEGEEYLILRESDILAVLG